MVVSRIEHCISKGTDIAFMNNILKEIMVEIRHHGCKKPADILGSRRL